MQLTTVSNKQNIDNFYSFSKLLGHGSFAYVKLAYPLHDKSVKKAIKFIQKEQLKDKTFLFLRELNILKSLDHPNIIKFDEIFEDEKYFYIVQEYCEGGELLKRITKKGFLSESESMKIIKKVFLAVNHMHEKQVVHRDLKPENILFVVNNEDSDIRIIDFGLSNSFKLRKNKK